MQPRIEKLRPKKLIGKKMSMSLADNKTGILWQNFMQKRKEIQNSIGTDFYSLQLYDDLYFKKINPAKTFDKWAAIEVTEFENVPADMEPIIVNGGLYAVFTHKGGASTSAQTFEYIFRIWLPNSEYTEDNSRLHFEILGEKYKKQPR